LEEEQLEWEYLAIIPFSSDRKRMSIVVREPKTNRLVIMSKGADSIMKPLLSSTSKNVETLQDQLDGFAMEGLRTLVMAQKYIDESEFNSWY
jgi:P-type E1-E2 ATPase